MCALIAILLLSTSSDAPDPTNVNPWAQFGIGAIVFALLFAWGFSQWRDCKAKDKTIADLHRELLLRERELGQTMVPVLKEAIGILSAAPAQFDRALGEARDATRGHQLEDLTSKLERLVGEIGKR